MGKERILKKIICGILTTITGMFFSLAFMAYAVVNAMGLPNFFNALRVTGTLGSFLFWVCVALGGMEGANP